MTDYSKENLRLLKLAPLLSMITAIVIALTKLYSWYYTSSASILASLVDSLLDLSTSVINFIALRAALVPPDHKHRFGHNKIEDLAVFGQSAAFFASGIFTLYNSAYRMANPQPLEFVSLGIYAMVISSVLTIFLVAFQSIVIQRTKSTIVEVDRLHYITDLLTNLLVIISLYFSSTYLSLDAILAVLIACYIMKSSYGLFVRATKNLVDEEMNDAEREKIIDIIRGHKKVLGVHELKTRLAGSKAFIQLHLELDGDMKLYDAHEISDEVMNRILKEFPSSEITIHQDPAGFEQDVPYREEL